MPRAGFCRVRGRLGLSALLVVLLVPMVPAQGPVTQCRQQCLPRDADVNGADVKMQPPVDLVLYAHFEQAGNAGLLNTQPVHPLREPDHRHGIMLPVVTGPGANDAGHVFYLNSLSSLIEMGHRWTHHNERGLSSSVILAGPPTLYLYLSASGPGGSSTASATPRLGVAAEIRRGAQGLQSALVADSSGADAQVTLFNDGFSDEEIYEIKVTLRPVQSVIGQSDHDGNRNRFFVKVRLYQIAAQGASVTQAEWRFHTGARFPPRLILPVLNPLEHAGLDVEASRGNLFLQWRVHGPLGSYDVDPSSYTLDMEALNGTRRLSYRPVRVDHDPHEKDSVAVWRVPGDDLRGTNPWVIKVAATNLQGTYRMTESRIDQPLVTFEEERATLPAWGPIASLAALLGLALLRRPRT